MSKMPKLDIEGLAIDTRTNYPPPFDRVVHGRERRRLGNAAGLDQFGVGTRAKQECVEYPDVDLVVVRDDKGVRYTHKNGDPYS
jgi:uncharacterized cupin superfamily protein